MAGGALFTDNLLPIKSWGPPNFQKIPEKCVIFLNSKKKETRKDGGRVQRVNLKMRKMKKEKNERNYWVGILFSFTILGMGYF